VVANELWLADDDRFLVADYEACKMPRAAMNLRRQLEHYRERGMAKVLLIKKKSPNEGAEVDIATVAQQLRLTGKH
jgi:hypothetical protein